MYKVPLSSRYLAFVVYAEHTILGLVPLWLSHPRKLLVRGGLVKGGHLASVHNLDFILPSHLLLICFSLHSFKCIKLCKVWWWYLTSSYLMLCILFFWHKGSAVLCLVYLSFGIIDSQSLQCNRWKLCFPLKCFQKLVWGNCFLIQGKVWSHVGEI